MDARARPGFHNEPLIVQSHPNNLENFISNGHSHTQELSAALWGCNSIGNGEEAADEGWGVDEQHALSPGQHLASRTACHGVAEFGIRCHVRDLTLEGGGHQQKLK